MAIEETISATSGKIFSPSEKTAILDAVYPIGSTYITSTNTNPSTKLGGEWTLTNKNYKSQHASSQIFGAMTWDSNKTGTSTQASCVLNGNTVRIRLAIYNTVALSDTTVVLGQLNMANAPFSGTAYDITALAFADTGNAVISLYCDWDGGSSTTGNVEIRDVFVRDAGNPATYPAGGNFAVDFSFPVPLKFMNDAYCDKFFWERTA